MRTIYQNLTDAGFDWAIYFHDFPQSLTLEPLQDSAFRGNFRFFLGLLPRPEERQAAALRLPRAALLRFPAVEGQRPASAARRLARRAPHRRRVRAAAGVRLLDEVAVRHPVRRARRHLRPRAAARERPEPGRQGVDRSRVRFHPPRPARAGGARLAVRAEGAHRRHGLRPHVAAGDGEGHLQAAGLPDRARPLGEHLHRPASCPARARRRSRRRRRAWSARPGTRRQRRSTTSPEPRR